MKEFDFKSLGFPTQDMYEFPSIVNVEVYHGNCPCRCVHCPVGITEPSQRKEKFPERGIDLDLYKKIVGEIAHYPLSVIRIHAVGEPMLWENLPDALAATYESGARSWIFTSAVTTNKDLLDHLSDHTSIVEVSVNSRTADDYRATKGIDAFKLVRNNIQYMHGRIAKRKLPTRLIVSRVQSMSRANDEDFVAYWKSAGLVDDAFVRTYHTYNDLMPILMQEPDTHHVPCLVHWGRFNIGVDGYAVVCFNELFKEHIDPSLILGDVNKQTISEIWHGPNLTALREAELSSNYSGLSFQNALPCKNCSLCQPLYGSRQTSEHQVKQLRKD